MISNAASIDHVPNAFEVAAQRCNKTNKIGNKTKTHRNHKKHRVGDLEFWAEGLPYQFRWLRNGQPELGRADQLEITRDNIHPLSQRGVRKREPLTDLSERQETAIQGTPRNKIPCAAITGRCQRCLIRKGMLGFPDGGVGLD